MPKKPSDEKQKCWRFSTAVYDEDDHKKMQDYPMFTYYCSGKEVCPETGNIHWQTYFETKKTRLSTLFRAFPKTTFRNTHGKLLESKGSWQDNKAYCHKDGVDLLERGEGKGEGPPNPYVNPKIEDKLYHWQKKLVEVWDQPADRRIYWIWSKHGSAGKTTFGKHLLHYYKDTIIVGGKAHDIRNAVIQYHEKTKRWPKRVIINIPRDHDRIDYEGFENVKDMFFYSGKYEGGMVSQEPCHVVVFANEHPNVKKMSLDRWAIYQIPIPNDYIPPIIHYLDWDLSLPQSSPNSQKIGPPSLTSFFQ